jgi:uncharacterized protein
MKILTVSDSIDPALYPVPDRQRFQDVSLILSCGDLAPEYLSFLVNMLSAPLYYVCGNHDIRHGTKPPQGGINLHARLLSFKGLNMLGLEGSMWYNGGPYQYTESEMRRMVRGLRIGIWWQGGIDVVIAHAPPRGVHDDQDLCHQGFETFRWLIHKYKPRYFIHGHIHRFFNEPSERVTTVDETQVINTYGCHILEVDDQERRQ